MLILPLGIFDGVVNIIGGVIVVVGVCGVLVLDV